MVLIGFCTAYIDTHTRPCADKHAGRNIETNLFKKKQKKQKKTNTHTHTPHNLNEIMVNIQAFRCK